MLPYIVEKKSTLHAFKMIFRAGGLMTKSNMHDKQLLDGAYQQIV